MSFDYDDDLDAPVRGPEGRRGSEGQNVRPRRMPETEESFSDRVARIRLELNRKKKRRRRILAMIIAECIVLAGIFSYAYMSRLWNLMPKPNVNKENVENTNISLESINKMQGYWMIAIFGVDSGTGTSSARGNSSDVNMIACINQDTGEIRLVSVYRDTYLKVNDKGTYRKFNYAYSEGGPEQALKMLNENLDLNITEYIIFNWKAVADGINILGGVDMEITKPEFKYINAFITETVQETGVASVHLKSAGMNHLDGIQAVAYGRLRLMDSDYQRVERQKKVIAAAFAKAKKADYGVLNNILTVCLQEVMTNLDFVDLTNAALNMTKYHIGETAGFPFERSEANMGKARGACIIPQSLESNVSELHQFLFGDESYEPSAAVKNISQKISSDSGVYAVQSKPASTTAASQPETEPEESAAEESSEAPETDENGVFVVPVPGIGETDENGELIDGPEPDNTNPSGGAYGPTDPHTGLTPAYPGGQTPGGSAFQGTTPFIPEESGPGIGPGTAGGPTSAPAGSENNNGVGGPGGATAPGGSITPGDSVTPEGNAGPGIGTTPGENAGPGIGTTPGSPEGQTGPAGGGGPLGAAGGSDTDTGVITGPGEGSESGPFATGD